MEDPYYKFNTERTDILYARLFASFVKFKKSLIYTYLQVLCAKTRIEIKFLPYKLVIPVLRYGEYKKNSINYLFPLPLHVI